METVSVLYLNHAGILTSIHCYSTNRHITLAANLVELQLNSSYTLSKSLLTPDTDLTL